MSGLELAGWLCAAVSVGVLAFWRVRLGGRLALVAEASHELRGPLTAMRLGLAAVMREAAPGPVRRRAAALDLELQRAGRALDDLAAAPSGRRAPDRAGPVDVADLLEEIGDAWSAVADAFGTRVQVESPAEWWLVRADRVRLAQAVGNLVANAIEHGGGPVTLRARRGENGVRIEVLDAGGGVPAHRLSAAGHAGARGHGLAIAARVADACGGALVSERRGAGGHVMALEFPGPQSRPAGHAASPFRSGRGSGRLAARVVGLPTPALWQRSRLGVPDR